MEEDYKIMKCRIEIENFTGKSVLSVYQDFHSAVFSKNITAMLVFAVRDKVAQETKQRQYDYKANFTQALSTIRDSIVLLFLRWTPGSRQITTEPKLKQIYEALGLSALPGTAQKLVI